VKSNTAFLALGSNLGDRLANLKKAMEFLHNLSGVHVVNTSSIFETEPVGFHDQDSFLNMVVRVDTGLTPKELLQSCLKIEKEIGRKRDIRWGPRTIDLDILLYNQENIETEELIIPHPRMHERAFVMIPLLEINRDIDIQMVEQPINKWVDNLPDKKGVRIWKQKNGEDVFALFES
jgi:2-amino-4-hydroxy-6-hydroxymethyldihydropteridine diphosphokinase